MPSRSELLSSSSVHRCMLLLTFLLVVCEVVVSRLCRSLINLVDGFHTLFILMHMALPLAPTIDGMRGRSQRLPTVTPLPVSFIPVPPPLTRPPPSLQTSLPFPLAPRCGLSYGEFRVRPVGALMSALFLASLCISVCLEIFSHTLQPHPIQRPLLAVVDCKGPNARIKGPSTGTSRPSSCLGHSEHQTVLNTPPSLQPVRPPDSPKPRGQKPACLPSILMLTRTLLCSILVLVNGLMLLLVDPESLHGPGACGLLVYLDPAFSTVAVIVLMGTALPQLYKYGLLVLQISPPKLCVPDLGRRIASVPGVQAVHDLHVWQLTETCTVASVHVHCHSGFQLHRCGDLLSAVTKVLQSEGVSCCTVQPEFPLSAPTANSSRNNNSSSSPPLIHREMPPLAPVMACSLACGKACAGKMCCTLLVEETCEPRGPSADEMEEEPQMLIIENTFL
ncbi:proton-coupled zinc antiporter SLC30A1 [Aplochiton taeniatus]